MFPAAGSAPMAPSSLQELPWHQSSPTAGSPRAALALQQPCNTPGPPGPARASSTCTSWTRKAPEAWQLLPLAPQLLGSHSAPGGSLGALGGLQILPDPASPGSLQPCGAAVGPSQPGTMNVFDRSINFDALFKFSHISASTQEHLKRVYGSFAICMFMAAAGAYINVVTHLFQFGLLTGLGALGLMVWLTATPHSRETEQKRLGMLVGFAFLTGINLGPLLQMCISINPSIIPTAFLGTATIFACFSLSALYARRRSYLYLGGFLLSGLSLMLLSSLLNAFVRSTWLFTANLYVALMIMCGFVLFDTQLIIEKAESGDKDYIWHCVDLFLDFVNIFRELLMILGMAENKKKEKK